MSFNPNEPRDYHGRWGDGNGSPASAAGHADGVLKPHELHIMHSNNSHPVKSYQHPNLMTPAIAALAAKHAKHPMLEM